MPKHSARKAPRIFLSYRREDTGGDAGRLRDSLRQRLGSEAAFYDLTGIGPGEDFAAKLTDALQASNVLLAIIGAAWESTKSQSGTSLSDRNDWVRRELIAGLKDPQIRVVPILVNREHPPRAADLPPALRSLARRNAYQIRRERWSVDVDELLRQLGLPSRSLSERDITALRKEASLVSLSIEWKRSERPDFTPRRWVVYIRNGSEGPIFVEKVVVKSPDQEETIEWGTVEPGLVSDYEMDEAQFDSAGDPPDVSMVFRDREGQRWQLSRGQLRAVRAPATAG